MQPPSCWRVAQVPARKTMFLGDQKNASFPLPILRQCPKLSSPQHTTPHKPISPRSLVSSMRTPHGKLSRLCLNRLSQSRPKFSSEPLPSAPTQALHGGREQGCFSRDTKCFQECSRGLPTLFSHHVAQSSFASMSAFAIGVKLSMSSPRAARIGFMCGGTSCWLSCGAMESS